MAVAEGDPQIAGSALNMGNAETGQTAMENLLSAHPDINVIYTINEPAAQGAFFAIKKAKRDVLVTSIDGSCSGVRSVADGTIGATVMQFPTRMGEMAVEAVIKAVNDGVKPSGFHNTGTVLITDHPVAGSIPRTPNGDLRTAGASEDARPRTDSGRRSPVGNSNHVSRGCRRGPPASLQRPSAQPVRLSNHRAAVRPDCYFRRVLAHHIDVHECRQYVADRPAIGGDRHIWRSGRR